MDPTVLAPLVAALESTAQSSEEAALADQFNDALDWVSITSEPISLEPTIARVLVPAAGAVSTFLGVTRNEFCGRRVVRLEYEAYTPMALREMRKLCVLARTHWPTLLRVAIAHRVGVVPVSDASVAIAVGSAHRAEGLAAVAWIIDELKARVPIWKREVYETDDAGGAGEPAAGLADGLPASRWKANSECLHHGHGSARGLPRHSHKHDHDGHGHGRHSHEATVGHSHEATASVDSA